MKKNNNNNKRSDRFIKKIKRVYIQQLKLHVIHKMKMILWSFLFCVVEYCSRCYVSFVCPFGLCLLMRMPFRFVSMSSVGNINLFFVSPWKQQDKPNQIKIYVHSCACLSLLLLEMCTISGLFVRCTGWAAATNFVVQFYVRNFAVTANTAWVCITGAKCARAK